MKITVFGPGCAKCVKTEDVVKEAIQQAGVEAETTHEKDIGVMARAGVMMTPALAIDGKVVISGKVPEVAEVISHITTALSSS